MTKPKITDLFYNTKDFIKPGFINHYLIIVAVVLMIFSFIISGCVIVTAGAENNDATILSTSILNEIYSDFEMPPSYRMIPDSPSEYLNISLDGEWLISEDRSFSSDVYKVKVPGEWRMQKIPDPKQGFYYYRTQLPFSSISDDSHYIIRFEAVYSDCEVYINGETAGSHLGGFNAFEIDITPYIIKGNNLIELKVRGKSEIDIYASGNQYAAHNMGGILRSVFCYELPELYLQDFSYIAEPSATGGAFFAASGQIVGLALMDAELIFEIDKIGYRKTVQIKSSTDSSFEIKSDVGEVGLWNPEKPILYDLKVTLNFQNKSVIYSDRIGFRKIEVRDNQLLVNGVSVKLRGINRHEVHPKLGRAITDELRKEDARLFKEANINFIRTSHYPPGDAFLNYCDEIGLFVEVEAPLCWVGHGANDYWKKYRYDSPHLFNFIASTNVQTILRHRNHPSVIMWSLANESLWSRNFEETHSIVKQIDSTRPYLFHDQCVGTYNNNGSSTEVSNFHYPGPNFKWISNLENRPLLFGEYSHLNVYNRQELVSDPGLRNEWGKWFDNMWQKMDSEKGILGGAVWSGIDDLFILDGGKSVGYGPWGIIDGFRRKKPEFWNMKKTYSPVIILSATINNGIKVKIHNKMLYTDLSELDIVLTQGVSSMPIELKCKPGESITQLMGGFSTNFNAPVFLVFSDEYGNLLQKVDLLDLAGIYKKKATADRFMGSKAISLEHENDKLLIKSKKGNISFDLKSATFSSFAACKISDKKKELTKSVFKGPFLSLVPLVSEQCLPEYRDNIEPSENIYQSVKRRVVAVNERADGVYIKIKEKGNYARGSYELTISGDGFIKIDYDFMIKKKIVPREAGIKLIMSKEFSSLEWNRDSFHDWYPRNHIGAVEGSAEAFYDNVSEGVIPLSKPNNDYFFDNTEFGSNGFRAGRPGIYNALLHNGVSGLKLISDGSAFSRTMVKNDKIEWTVAGFSSPGKEIFFESHLASSRKTFSFGSKLKGSMVFEIIKIN